MTEARARREAAFIELDVAARRARLPAARVRRYVRLGLVRPSVAEGRTALFDDVGVARLRRIRRLSDDLGLDTSAIEVVMRLVDHIERLQRELDAREDPGHVGGRRWQ
jgi:MerR family transcriptional regulator, heat shock protein HspR